MKRVAPRQELILTPSVAVRAIMFAPNLLLAFARYTCQAMQLKQAMQIKHRKKLLGQTLSRFGGAIFVIRFVTTRRRRWEVRLNWRAGPISR